MKNPKKAASEKAAVKDDGLEIARAHEADGTFKADDPSTPDVNEAYEVKNKKATKEAKKKDVGFVVVKVSENEQTGGVYLNVNGKRRHLPLGKEVRLPIGMLTALDDSNVEYEVIK